MENAGQFVPFAGVAVQWLRAQKNIPEWVTMLTQVVIGTAAYWMVHKTVDTGVWQAILLTIGSTQLASSAANMGVAAVPVTNSK